MSTQADNSNVKPDPASVNETVDHNPQLAEVRELLKDSPFREDIFDVFLKLRNALHERVPNLDCSLIIKAFIFAHNAHRMQFRASGKPYIMHPLNVALILTDMNMDQSTIMAGLLHDVVEDNTDISPAMLRREFGTKVADLVEGVTKLDGLPPSIEGKQVMNLRKMFLSMANDLRVVFIKFADRLHNMRTIEFVSEEKQQRIARETLEIYAPLAHRFGMARIKWELEDRCFKILYPDEYREISEKIALKREEREAFITEVITPIRDRIGSDKIQAQITGRPKHFYSIFNKMKVRGKAFEEIYDLFAVRVIVERVDQCYHALGIIHSTFTPINDQFSDYIATAKTNLYQSLHTKVVGPRGRIVEFQIRTRDMNKVAEYGVAAHWNYKEGVRDRDLDRFFSWFKEMMDGQNGDPTDAEYMDALKSNLFTDDIFVFTPRGKLIQLPIGSSPIDFAFRIHTDVGLHCIGSKVNRKIVPLDTELKMGDTVEVLTSRNHHPSLDWLKFVKTSKARTKIRKWYRESQYDSSLKLGQEILQKTLQRYRQKKTNDELNELARHLDYKNLELLLADLGSGELTVNELVDQLEPDQDADKGSFFGMFKFHKSRTGDDGSPGGVRVNGVDNIMISFARCCQPLPGDPILGFVTTGKGIVIHRANCNNAQQIVHDHADKVIEVAWDLQDQQLFVARLQIVGSDRKSLLRDISDNLARQDVNIRQFSMRTRDKMVFGKFIVEVSNLEQLKLIIKRLKGVKGVFRVERHDGSGT